MATVDVPWPSTSNPGAAPGEGSGRLLNAFAYKDGGGLRWRSVPGLALFASLPAGDIRGGLFQGSILLLVVGNRVLQIDASGTQTVLDGILTGDGPVTMARNNNATSPAVVFSTSTGNFYINPSNVVVPYPDTNLPQTNSVAILDGFFFWTTADGRAYASGLNDTSVNPLSVARAEARPDGLLRAIVYGQILLLMGTDTIEPWQDVGATPFPAQRQDVIPVGLFGPWAVSGYEDGWGGPLIFVAQDGSVRQLSGYTPTRISGEDLERLIAKVSNRTELRASCYTIGGNAFWSLSSTTWTWEYNVTTGFWHERRSYLKPRWRAAFVIRAFGRTLAAEAGGSAGSLYTINPDIAGEGADPLVWGLDSGPVKEFPVRIKIARAAYDFVLGQSNGMPADPKVMLSWSHDGAATWAKKVERSVGAQGVYAGRVAVHRMGLTTHHGIRLRFRVSDPIYTSFAGARIEAQGTR